MRLMKSISLILTVKSSHLTSTNDVLLQQNVPDLLSTSLIYSQRSHLLSTISLTLNDIFEPQRYQLLSNDIFDSQ